MIELLNKSHDRSDFNCGNELLNNYIKFQVNQDIKRKLAVCFVYSENQKVKGYYTLSNNSIPLQNLPLKFQKKLPKSYNSIPSTLLGRLAIDELSQGNGLGKILLIDALKKSYEISKKIGSFAVVVDPIDQNAENFYLKYDFIKLPDSKKLFIAMGTLDELFKIKQTALNPNSALEKIH